MVAEMEGESVTLKPATEINKDDSIQWLYGDEEQQTVIAEFTGETGEIFTYAHVADGRFRDRLELDKTTGSLTIKNTRTELSGLYHLQIRSNSGLSYQTFSVTVKDKVEKKLLIGDDSVTLNPDTEIQRDDLILWMFGVQDKLIAQIKGGTGEIYGDANERFRDRLKLNEKTGSLTITNIEAVHLGLYKVLTISSSRGTLCKIFRVSINLSYVERRKGEYVRLYTGLTEILTDDEIQWMFGDENSLIADIKGRTGKTYDVLDGRFRGSLELNNQTGDLTINNSTVKHAGDYKLKIRSSKGNTNSTYIVIIKVSYEKVTAGDSFRLYTGLIVKKTDLIQWMFGDENTLIAEIKGGTGETYDGPDGRFRGSLVLNTLTGSLTINNSTAKHAGDYKLKIRSSKGNTNSTYTVIIKGAAVTDEVREESSMKEKNDCTEKRVNESATVVMPLLNREDVDVVNEEEGTSSL